MRSFATQNVGIWSWRLLSYRSRAKTVADFLGDCRNGDHTSSVSRNTVIFLRDGCIRSRIEGMRRADGFLRAYDPTQRAPLRSHSLPQQQQSFENASGRGGQPGT